MKILGNFILGLYANISMLKDVWEEYTKTKLDIKIIIKIWKRSKAFRITNNLKY